VRIVILRNLPPEEDHAAVAARVDGQWLILDNRRLALVRDTEMVGSIPKFVLDEDGTRRFECDRAKILVIVQPRYGTGLHLFDVCFRVDGRKQT
jgi:hypothetical protein